MVVAMAELDETDFEGTLVLEQLAAVGLVEDFFEAADEDDLDEARRLMVAADVDRATIAVVLAKMAAGDDEP